MVSKAIAHGTHASSEVVLPDEVLQLQRTASALPPVSKVRTTTRRSCRDSVDVLLEEAEAMLPQQPRRRCRGRVDVLLGEAEAEAEAVQSQQAVNTHWYADNILAPVVAPGATDFLNVLYKCSTICHKCQYTVNFEALGFGPAKSIYI